MQSKSQMINYIYKRSFPNIWLCLKSWLWQ
uniref:Uncharacterized protein n=1 Tax=Tetranychus urticae TaxID=32264 RepID=T1L3Y8_TETUR